MMLYGSLTMGSCYLVASMCLKAVDQDPSKELVVSASPMFLDDRYVLSC